MCYSLHMEMLFQPVYIVRCFHWFFLFFLNIAGVRRFLGDRRTAWPSRPGFYRHGTEKVTSNQLLNSFFLSQAYSCLCLWYLLLFFQQWWDWQRTCSWEETVSWRPLFSSGEWLDQVTSGTTVSKYALLSSAVTSSDSNQIHAACSCWSRAFGWMASLHFAIQGRLLPAFAGALSSVIASWSDGADPRWRLAPIGMGCGRDSACKHEKLPVSIAFAIRPVYILRAC